jgi:hypothetical protein
MSSQPSLQSPNARYAAALAALKFPNWDAAKAAIKELMLSSKNLVAAHPLDSDLKCVDPDIRDCKNDAFQYARDAKSHAAMEPVVRRLDKWCICPHEYLERYGTLDELDGEDARRDVENWKMMGEKLLGMAISILEKYAELKEEFEGVKERLERGGS